MTALFLYTQNMKKIIFLIVCLISFSAKADMNKICVVDFGKDWTAAESYILENCERNNVLFWYEPVGQIELIANWCRFDRNIERIFVGSPRQFTCILYSNKPREYIGTIK